MVTTYMPLDVLDNLMHCSSQRPANSPRHAGHRELCCSCWRLRLLLPIARRRLVLTGQPARVTGNPAQLLEHACSIAHRDGA